MCRLSWVRTGSRVVRMIGGLWKATESPSTAECSCSVKIRNPGVLADRPEPGSGPSGFLYASGEWQRVFVNLFLTLSSPFFLLKDLQRNRLAGRLTKAPARPSP